MYDNVRQLLKRLYPVQAPVPLIRVGSEHDGGYLIPDLLDGIEYCFSPGVGDKVDFDAQLADRGIRSFMVDSFENGPTIFRPEFTFDRLRLSAMTGDGAITFDGWKEHYIGDYNRDLVMQMDIEGGEYEAIPSISDSLLCRFRICSIEFHGLDGLLDNRYDVIAASFDRMLDFFEVVHIHPNNWVGATRTEDLVIPQILEFTFLNKRCFSLPLNAYVTSFPHPLDADNNPAVGSVVLPSCWYQSEL